MKLNVDLGEFNQLMRLVQAQEIVDRLKTDYDAGKFVPDRKNRLDRIKELALQKARDNVSGAPLWGGRTIHIRSGRLLAGIRVEDAPGGFRIVSTATNNGVSYGYVLEHGATIVPKTKKALCFRVPQGAVPHIGFAGYSETLVFSKRCVIPAFAWMEKAMQDAILEGTEDLFQQEEEQ